MYKDMKMTFVMVALALMLVATLFVATAQHGYVVDGAFSAEIADGDIIIDRGSVVILDGCAIDPESGECDPNGGGCVGACLPPDIDPPTEN